MRTLRKRKYAIGAAVAALVMAWVAADYLVTRSRTRGWTRVASVEFIRHEGGVVYSERDKLFVVIDGARLFALSSISPHSPDGPEPVLYCASSGYFEALRHGEKFDGHGVVVAGPPAHGPAPSTPTRGMDRYPVKSYRGFVYVKPKEVTPGPARDADASRERKGASCSQADASRPGFWIAAS